MADKNFKIVDGNLNVMTGWDHEKALRDRDGGIGEYIEQDAQESQKAYAEAKIERARRRKEAAIQAKKREFSQNADKRIAEDEENGEAAAARREYEKEDAAYKKRKEAFDRMVEARKAQRA